MTLMAVGATAAATTGFAATDTNTFTNVVQSVNISLIAYSNAVPDAKDTGTVPVRPVTITTKTIVDSLEADAANIPSIATNTNFSFGKAPTLVYLTSFGTNIVNSNTVVTNEAIAIFTNTVAPDLTNSGVAYSVTTNLAAVITNIVTTNSTNYAFVETSPGTVSNTMTTNTFLYSTNGVAATITIPTNFGPTAWVSLTGSAVSTNETNVTFALETNLPAAVTYTNTQGIAVQGGTAASPLYAPLSGFLTVGSYASVTNTAAGTDLGKTNELLTSSTKNEAAEAYITFFGASGTSNFDLSLYGFSTVMKKYDVLKKAKSLTNEVYDTTITASVAGSGDISGTYATNTSIGAGTNATSLYTSGETVAGTNTAISGIIENPIPVVVKGTITIGAPRSVPQ